MSRRPVEGSSRFVRYLVVGGTANTLVMTTYYALTMGCGLGPSAAISIASTACFALSYIGNKIWTFACSGRRRLLRFGVVYLGSCIFQAAFLRITAGWGGMPHELMMPLGLGVAVAGSYLLQAIWVFRKPADKTSGELSPSPVRC